MELRDAYKQKMAAQLKEWSAQIDLLEAKVENAGADMKVKHAEQLHALRAKQQAAHDKLTELEKAGGEAWEQVKKTSEIVWNALKAGLAEARSKFS